MKGSAVAPTSFRNYPDNRPNVMVNNRNNSYEQERGVQAISPNNQRQNSPMGQETRFSSVYSSGNDSLATLADARSRVHDPFFSGMRENENPRFRAPPNLTPTPFDINHQLQKMRANNLINGSNGGGGSAYQPRVPAGAAQTNVNPIKPIIRNVERNGPAPGVKIGHATHVLPVNGPFVIASLDTYRSPEPILPNFDGNSVLSVSDCPPAKQYNLAKDRAMPVMIRAESSSAFNDSSPDGVAHKMVDSDSADTIYSARLRQYDSREMGYQQAGFYAQSEGDPQQVQTLYDEMTDSAVYFNDFNNNGVDVTEITNTTFISDDKISPQNFGSLPKSSNLPKKKHRHRKSGRTVHKKDDKTYYYDYYYSESYGSDADKGRDEKKFGAPRLGDAIGLQNDGVKKDQKNVFAEARNGNKGTDKVGGNEREQVFKGLESGLRVDQRRVGEIERQKLLEDLERRKQEENRRKMEENRRLDEIERNVEEKRKEDTQKKERWAQKMKAMEEEEKRKQELERERWKKNVEEELLGMDSQRKKRVEESRVRMEEERRKWEEEVREREREMKRRRDQGRRIWTEEMNALYIQEQKRIGEIRLMWENNTRERDIELKKWEADKTKKDLDTLRKIDNERSRWEKERNMKDAELKERMEQERRRWEEERKRWEVEIKKINEVESRRVNDIDSRRVNDIDSRRINDVDSRRVNDIDSRRINDVDSRRVNDVDSRRINDIDSRRVNDVDSRRINDIDSRRVLAQIDSRKRSPNVSIRAESPGVRNNPQNAMKPNYDHNDPKERFRAKNNGAGRAESKKKEKYQEGSDYSISDYYAELAMRERENNAGARVQRDNNTERKNRPGEDVILNNERDAYRNRPSSPKQVTGNKNNGNVYESKGNVVKNTSRNDRHEYSERGRRARSYSSDSEETPRKDGRKNANVSRDNRRSRNDAYNSDDEYYNRRTRRRRNDAARILSKRRERRGSSSVSSRFLDETDSLLDERYKRNTVYDINETIYSDIDADEYSRRDRAKPAPRKPSIVNAAPIASKSTSGPSSQRTRGSSPSKRKTSEPDSDTRSTEYRDHDRSNRHSSYRNKSDSRNDYGHHSSREAHVQPKDTRSRSQSPRREDNRYHSGTRGDEVGGNSRYSSANARYSRQGVSSRREDRTPLSDSDSLHARDGARSKRDESHSSKRMDLWSPPPNGRGISPPLIKTSKEGMAPSGNAINRGRSPSPAILDNRRAPSPAILNNRRNPSPSNLNNRRGNPLPEGRVDERSSRTPDSGSYNKRDSSTATGSYGRDTSHNSGLQGAQANKAAYKAKDSAKNDGVIDVYAGVRGPKPQRFYSPWPRANNEGDYVQRDSRNQTHNSPDALRKANVEPGGGYEGGRRGKEMENEKDYTRVDKAGRPLNYRPNMYAANGDKWSLPVSPDPRGGGKGFYNRPNDQPDQNPQKRGGASPPRGGIRSQDDGRYRPNTSKIADGRNASPQRVDNRTNSPNRVIRDGSFLSPGRISPGRRSPNVKPVKQLKVAPLNPRLDPLSSVNREKAMKRRNSEANNAANNSASKTAPAQRLQSGVNSRQKNQKHDYMEEWNRYF